MVYYVYDIHHNYALLLDILLIFFIKKCKGPYNYYLGETSLDFNHIF